jgi:hypothetical protein
VLFEHKDTDKGVEKSKTKPLSNGEMAWQIELNVVPC